MGINAGFNALTTPIEVDLPKNILPEYIDWEETFYNDYFTDEELYQLVYDYEQLLTTITWI